MSFSAVKTSNISGSNAAWRAAENRIESNRKQLKKQHELGG
jgi:hypothetical protein